MQVEIGALVHKDCGPAVLEAMRETVSYTHLTLPTNREV